MSDYSDSVDFFDGMALILFALLLLGRIHFSWGWKIIIAYSILKVIGEVWRHLNE